eukprot:885625-Amphidinium_carterae.1
MRISWLYFASLSERHGAPVLISPGNKGHVEWRNTEWSLMCGPLSALRHLKHLATEGLRTHVRVIPTYFGPHSLGGLKPFGLSGKSTLERTVHCPKRVSSNKPVRKPTTKSAMNVSSVSPERCETCRIHSC